MGREVEGTIYLTFSTLDGPIGQKGECSDRTFCSGGSRPFRFEKRKQYVVQLKYLQKAYTRTLIKQKIMNRIFYIIGDMLSGIRSIRTVGS